MPANLTPEYKLAEKRFREAKGNPEKISALEEMLSVIPKHKGTDKMRASLRKRLSRLRTEGERKSSKSGPSYNVPSEGAGQLFLVGPPNSGKSSLLDVLTNVTPTIATYPFTTRTPDPGMMPYEDILIQIVDMPPISKTHTEPWISSVVRNGDALLLVVDPLSVDIEEETEEVIARLKRSKLQTAGKSYPIDDLPSDWLDIHTLIVANKMDLSDADVGLELFCELYADEYEILPISTKTLEGMETLQKRVFEVLDIVRVYSKMPGKTPDYSAPFCLSIGSTIEDLARSIHRDIASKLRFARAGERTNTTGNVWEKTMNSSTKT